MTALRTGWECGGPRCCRSLGGWPSGPICSPGNLGEGPAWDRGRIAAAGGTSLWAGGLGTKRESHGAARSLSLRSLSWDLSKALSGTLGRWDCWEGLVKAVVGWPQVKQVEGGTSTLGRGDQLRPHNVCNPINQRIIMHGWLASNTQTVWVTQP